MKNKILAIVGALLFVAAVVIGNFCNFAAANITEIALAAFGLAAVIVSTINAQKKAGSLSWKTILIIVLAVVGGVLVAVGGASSNIFEQLAGLVVALITIIIGLTSVTKKAE